MNIRIAKLAFHAKESPIRTWDEVFNIVSSQSWSPAEGIVRLSEHPLIQDSLKDDGEASDGNEQESGKITAGRGRREQAVPPALVWLWRLEEERLKKRDRR